MPVLIGGLLLVTARPAAACSCAVMSEAKKAAYADAIFVGTLIDRRIGQPSGAATISTHMAVWTFEVSRVYKGTVSRRQEIATAMSGASCGLELSGPGPFLVFARRPNDPVAKSWWGDRQLDPGQYVSHLCLGSRALSDGGEPTVDGPPPSSASTGPFPSTGILARAGWRRHWRRSAGGGGRGCTRSGRPQEAASGKRRLSNARKRRASVG